MTEFVTWEKLCSRLPEFYRKATRDEEYWPGWKQLLARLPYKAERDGCFDLDDLSAIAVWGGDQRGIKKRMRAATTPVQVKQVTAEAIRHLDTPAEALRAILPLKHWGLTYGSKTLTFMRPSEYAILDQWRIRAALRNFEAIYRIKDGDVGSEVEGYVAYLKICRKLRDEVTARPPPEAGGSEWRIADIGQALFALAQNDCVVLPRLRLVDGD